MSKPVNGMTHGPRGVLGWLVSIGALTTLLLMLSGCLSSVPSNFPTIQLPQPQSPSQSGSPSTPSSPSSSTQSQQGSQGASGMPQPQSPIPQPSSPDPSLPQPPNPGLPSSDTDGNPGTDMLPSLENPNAGEDGESDIEGLPGMPPVDQEGDEEEEGEGGETAEGQEAVEPGSEIDAENAGGDLYPGSRMPGAGEQDELGTWEISNQLPAAGTSSGQDRDGAYEQVSGGLGPEDAELQATLNELDGSIMSGRSDEQIRANDRAVAAGGPNILEEAQDESALGVANSEDTEDGAPQETLADGVATPNLPATKRGEADGADARDKEVIARQMREAAIAETDPDVKAGLWEEYEKYVKGL